MTLASKTDDIEFIVKKCDGNHFTYCDDIDSDCKEETYYLKNDIIDEISKFKKKFKKLHDMIEHLNSKQEENIKKIKLLEKNLKK